jgi:hypothetical protein
MSLKRDKMCNILMPEAAVKNIFAYIHGSLDIPYNQVAHHYVREFFQSVNLKLDLIQS